MADLLNIGLSGLAASKTQLSVTGHNITNVNTAGYTRQDATQATRVPQFSGAGYIGSGTTIVEVRRSYSEFLTQQLRSSTALASDAAAYQTQISQLDSMLASTTTGITPSLKSFFAALQTAAEDPSNLPARELVLAEAGGLAKRFNTLYDRLYQQNDSLNKQMTTVTDQVNRLATTIGSLNNSIAIAAANGKQPNDLLDAREEAVRQLSGYVGVTVVPQDDSSYNLFIGSGQPLVVGSTVNSIQASPGQGDPNRYEIEFVSGNSRQTITSMINGGELGGLIRYRADALDSTLNSLGRMALVINEELNSQLGQGLDLKGNVGTALFNDMNGSELMKLRVNAFSTNTGNVAPSLRITDANQLTASDYRLEFDGTSYTARRLSDGATMTVTADSSPISYPLTLSFGDGQTPSRDQGFTVELASAPAAGDKFLLQPTRRGAADIAAVLDQADQLAFAAPFRSEAVTATNKGTGTLGQPAVTLTIDPGSLPQPALQSEQMNRANLAAVGTLTLQYDATAGELVFQTPLPAGVTITSAPQASAAAPGAIGSLPITSGQGNTLSFAIEVTTGGVTQSYTISQTFSGVPKDGDAFTLSFNKSGVSDNRNALALVDLQNKQTVGVDPHAAIATGASFTDAYGAVVERVGTLTAQSRLDSDATTAILKQATDNRDSLSGVNLDEEAANLIKFEQYYNASAQVIQVARSLFDTLINAFR